MTKIIFLCFLIIRFYPASAQNDSAGVFQSIANELKAYRPDTSAAPDDKITRKIVQLRSLRGGFNIEEAIAYKIEEEKGKTEKSKEEIQKLSDYFSIGHGHQLLTNAVIWIYRQQFTYSELKKLVKFYKTSAGQKLSQRFPVIMLKSLAAAEIIKSTITH